MSGYNMDGKSLQQLDSVAEALKEQFERRKFWFLCGFSLVYLGITCLLASRKLMWNDELFTFYIARLPSLSDVWSALSTGADQIPPFFHILTRASFSMLGVNHLSVRLPEILGFWLMSLCLFRFVSKRSSALYGFVAMLFPLITTAYDYAYEARPYGLVLGFSGLAVLFWQLAAEGYRRKFTLLGLCLSIAAAVSSHYYAVLLLFPIAVGEVTRSISQRRLDLPVWVALGLAMTPLLLFLPLIAQARTYSSHFWAQPHWRNIPEFYYFLLIPAVVPLVAPLILSGMFSTTQPSGLAHSSPVCHTTTTVHEIAVAVGFIAMPIIAVILAKITTGAFTFRYALPSVIGFSMLLAFSACNLFHSKAIISVALIFVFFTGSIALQMRSLHKVLTDSLEQDNIHQFLHSTSQINLPIVVSDLHSFTILAHYATPDLASRLIYLADPRTSLRYLGHTTVDQGIIDLKPWFSLNIEEYSSYTTLQDYFLLFVYHKRLNGYRGGLNWIFSELSSTNRRIELIGQSHGNLLFSIGPTN